MPELALPKGLKAVLAAVVDREFAGRMARVCAAAARCIEQLQAINLVSLEPVDAEEGSADLALWEQMAPAVADTVAAINGLCLVVEREFPEAAGRTGVFSSDSSDERAEAEAALVFQSVSRLLRERLAEVRDMVRRPELMASRWALLEELQRLRALFRRRVGDAVYLSAAATSSVRREDVVPGASQEVQRALLYRATAADLFRQVRNRLARREEPLPKLLSALGGDLSLFASMPAWRHVHAGPKRHFLMVRAFLERPGVDRAGLDEAIEGLLATLADVSEELSREVLASHDLQVFADTAFRLEQARLHVSLGTGAAGWAFGAAATLAEKLRGRSERIDAVLRGLKRDPPDPADDAQVLVAVDRLRDVLTEAASLHGAPAGPPGS
ncbi:MAG: hypothetical protein INH41_09120 [Myxococcaceae bacterium]|jgi:hypothetical protein|nr:hypothetical protein [Myxococcaceae bacterium]MCA3012545.1 hypothetical protein [Myxococcaceae bacterium]